MDSNKSHQQRQTLCAFFVEVLGIEQKAAEEGVSKMEAAVSMEVTERMVQYACNLKENAPKQKSEKADSS